MKSKNIFLALLLIFAISVAMSVLFSLNYTFSSFSSFLKSISFGMTLGCTFWLSNAILGNLIRKYRLWTRSPRKGTTISLLLYIITGIVISLTIPYVFAKYVWHTSGNNLLSHVLFNAFLSLVIDLILISFFFSKYLVDHWLESLQNEAKLKQEKLIAQYETLKNQVNPHFLFNTLNTLTGLVEQNPDEAVPFIRKLSDIYRYVLEQKDKAIVPLAEELSFVNDYIYLMKIRYGNGFVSSIQIADQGFFVAPLALQMLVENALKHNIVSDDQPLSLTIYSEMGFLIIKNNIQKKTSRASKEAIGLENLVNRYTYLSDKRVVVEEFAGEFIVKLPILEEPVQ